MFTSIQKSGVHHTDCFKPEGKKKGEWCRITKTGRVKGINWDYCEELEFTPDADIWDGPLQNIQLTT